MDTNKKAKCQCDNCFHETVCSLRTEYIQEQERVNEIMFVKPVELECIYFAPSNMEVK